MNLLMLTTAFWMITFSVQQDQESWPQDTSIEGPSPVCEGSFSLHIFGGEKLTRRDPGLHFYVYYLETADGNLGIYSGSYPQIPDGLRSVDMHDEFEFEYAQNEAYGNQYLVNLRPDESLPHYLHFFGDALSGDDADRELLGRFDLADYDRSLCNGAPTNGF